MKKEDTKIIGVVDESTIERWKKTNRKVYQVEVVEDDVQHIGYFKKPDMDTYAAVSKLSKTSEVKGVETLFDNCWLGGSEDIKSDATLKLNAVTAFNTALNSSIKVNIKNL